MKFHRPTRCCALRRGYYTYGGRNHDVCEFELRFDNGTVKGRGVDDVGLTSCGPTTTGKKIHPEIELLLWLLEQSRET